MALTSNYAAFSEWIPNQLLLIVNNNERHSPLYAVESDVDVDCIIKMTHSHNS